MLVRATPPLSRVGGIQCRVVGQSRRYHYPKSAEKVLPPCDAAVPSSMLPSIRTTSSGPRPRFLRDSLNAISQPRASQHSYREPFGLPTRSSTSTRHLSTAASSSEKMYTTSTAFFETLRDAGVTHCFVNLGSDHPSIMEALAEKGQGFPRIITCPNEMVAMSMADGFARLTRQPQCVIVHVDVGTQGLGAAVHNASMGRAPVLVFAGLSPFTLEGELPGSRTEFIHWVQDVPDQKAIVSQYCRYSAELKTGRNVKQMVNRALQISSSAPQGPVYLCGAREVMAEEIQPYGIDQGRWQPTRLGALPLDAVGRIAQALAGAKSPLLITGFSGRDHNCPALLVALADAIPRLRVLDTAGSDMCFPASHPAWLGVRYGSAPEISSADVILVLDADVPWIPTQCRPPERCRIFHVDADPLKRTMPVFYIDAHERFVADAGTVVRQLVEHLDGNSGTDWGDAAQARESRRSAHAARIAEIEARCASAADGTFGAGHVCRQLRRACPDDTIWAVEAVTNTIFVADALQVDRPGHFINCGGGGLGWSGGGALGIKLATDHCASGVDGKDKGKFVCQIVADGTFMFSVPSSVHWIARRYGIPVLTVILNNNGWHAPKRSLLLVHPDGAGSKATNEELNISFKPTPDYSGIAKAAAGGDLFAARVAHAADLPAALKAAVEAVEKGKSAVVDCSVVPGS